MVGQGADDYRLFGGVLDNQTIHSCFSIADLSKGGQNQHREWTSRNQTAKRMTLNQQVMSCKTLPMPRCERDYIYVYFRFFF